jgi:hypothetical protein
MKRSEARPALKTILTAAFPSIPVYLDNGSKAISDQMETALQNGGVCIAIGPILETKLAEPASRLASHEKATIAVHLRQNPDLAASLDHDETVSAIQSAVLSANITGKSWSQPDRTSQLVVADLGCLTTAIFFNATILT